MNINEHPVCSKNLSVLHTFRYRKELVTTTTCYVHKSIRFPLLPVTHLVPNLVNYSLLRGMMITEIFIQQLDVCMLVCGTAWNLGLVNFRCAAVVNRSVSFQRCTTLDLIHQRFVTYPRVRQRFTVDQASHSEGLPRKSLLRESRVQILQEANAGFGEHIVSTAPAATGATSEGVTGRTAATGAHLVIVSLTIWLRLLLLLLHLLLVVMVATTVVGGPLVRDVTPVVDRFVRWCSRVSVRRLLLLVMLQLLLLVMLLLIVLG